jgi:hypothetical protein
MPALKVDQPVRDLQDQLTTDHPDLACYYGMCQHETKPPALPGGVDIIRTTDFNTTPPRETLTLVRYKARIFGSGAHRFRQGWYVVRADNGRQLGWICREERGDHKGTWSIRVCDSAFKGDSVDDPGNALDRVPHHLYNGVDDGAGSANPIGYAHDRADAAAEIVARLVQRRAPAVGYGPRDDVTVYHSRPEQHIAIGAAEDRCLCDEAWPCPKRAALVAGQTPAGAR